MLKKQQFVVIGLGVFGATIATELARLGQEVLGIDTDEKRVDQLADTLTKAVVGDVTDHQTLEEMDAGDYDVAVVAIGRNIEAALLATMQLREMGVEKVWAKALTTQHRRILSKLGATRVIGPEFEMGMAIAQELNYPMVNNFIGLGDEEFIVEIIASERLADMTISDLQDKARVTILAIKREADTRIHPPNKFRLRENDQVVIAGQLSELRDLAEHL
ncbi:MAG: TrkA family potassium uptake protein [Oleiphilaceae bacterium]|nr:TrkA family potassium uptake protein [Oleiphilaceae bacterium]